ncbi:MAG TPA: hypothetical protein DCL00_04310 [Opitutae bacterium]|nr:hypothetical protein [Opitutae bacterium]HAF58793.1 hypothetical protein [Opitutae bacterium]|tara:strand:- start:547 stop:831 length:285 start_codon:yes stop_codon:yes gene_type:complete
MNLFHRQFVFTLNILFFASLIIAIYFQTGLVYLFCVLGLLLNLLYFFKEFAIRAKSSPSIEGASEPDFTEKNMIMEDLDREAARRREVEQFNKN